MSPVPMTYVFTLCITHIAIMSFAYSDTFHSFPVHTLCIYFVDELHLPVLSIQCGEELRTGVLFSLNLSLLFTYSLIYFSLSRIVLSILNFSPILKNHIAIKLINIEIMYKFLLYDFMNIKYQTIGFSNVKFFLEFLK